MLMRDGHIPPRAPRGGAEFTGRPVSRDRAALEDVTTNGAAGPGLPPLLLSSTTIGWTPQERVASQALRAGNYKVGVLVHALA